MKNTKPLKLLSFAPLPTKFGAFQIYVFLSKDKLEHVALVHGKPRQEPAVVRVHSQCLTGDTFQSRRCDCGSQLTTSLKILGQSKYGVLLYLNQEGRGIGLANKIKTYNLQDQGFDTADANIKLGFPADARRYDIAAAMLNYLKINKILLLTNNPDKECQLFSAGIKIAGTLPLEIKPNRVNKKYLQTKKHRFGHKLRLV
ncbi:MAG: GTP cyclohydrolase II [Candidatus Magasanikbacteria bacterium]|nr:GTP cyclohydrolase II [Candidatus Magasanikbacteria bacterium]